MSSNLKVNSLVPATGTEIGIGTTGGSIDFRCPATFGGNVTIGGTLTYDEVINIDSIGIITARSNIDCNGDLDVDGQTNLDHVNIAGITTLSTGINLTPATSNLYATDGALSYYSANNGVYLCGAGANGWLRLQAAGSANDRTSINLKGHSMSGGDSIYFRTNSTERLNISSTGSITASGTISPTANNTYDLGGSSNRWRHLHINNVSVAGVTTFAGNIKQTAPGSNTAKITLNNASDTTGMDVGYSESSGVGFINVGQSGSGLSIKTGGLAAGNERFVITSAGNVGIASITPAERLVVQGDGFSNFAYDKDGGGFDGTSGGALVLTGIFDYSGSKLGLMVDNAGQGRIFNKTAQALHFGQNNQKDMTIAGTSGYVGINTTSPDSYLEVFGGTNSIQVGNQSGSGRFGADGTSTKIGSHSNHHLDLFTNGASNTRLRIDSGGDVTVNTGTLYIPQWISHVGDTDSKFGFLQPDIIEFQVAGTQRLKIMNTGQIRIDQATSANNGIRMRPSGWNYDFRIGAVSSSGGSIWLGQNYEPTGGTRDNASYGTNYIRFTTQGEILFGTGATDTNPTERMKIKSDGKIGINESSPQQLLHVHDDTNYQGILINGNGAPRIAFARGTTTTGEWSVGIDGTNGNQFVINNSNDNSNRKVIVSSSGLTAAGTITSGGGATFNGVVTFNGPYQQGNASAGLALFGSSAQSRGVVISHGVNDMRPTHNNDVDLGTSGQRWKTIYSNNSLNTSDKNLKNTIVDSDLGLSFINKLRPVSYKWNQKEEESLDTKTHYGLIAQEIETAIISEGKTLNDFAGVFKPDDYKDDGTGGAMGISLNEIISPLIKAIQELSAEVAALKSS